MYETYKKTTSPLFIFLSFPDWLHSCHAGKHGFCWKQLYRAYSFFRCLFLESSSLEFWRRKHQCRYLKENRSIPGFYDSATGRIQKAESDDLKRWTPWPDRRYGQECDQSADPFRKGLVFAGFFWNLLPGFPFAERFPERPETGVYPTVRRLVCLSFTPEYRWCPQNLERKDLLLWRSFHPQLQSWHYV